MQLISIKLLLVGGTLLCIVGLLQDLLLTFQFQTHAFDFDNIGLQCCMRSYPRLRTHSASPIPSSFASHSSHPAIPLTLVPSASPLLSSFSITFESPRLLHSLASVPSLFPPIAAPSTPSSSKNHPSMYSS
eukprot:821343_1